jgi:hypothetical protein
MLAPFVVGVVTDQELSAIATASAETQQELSDIVQAENALAEAYLTNGDLAKARAILADASRTAIRLPASDKTGDGPIDQPNWLGKMLLLWTPVLSVVGAIIAMMFSRVLEGLGKVYIGKLAVRVLRSPELAKELDIEYAPAAPGNKAADTRKLVKPKRR